MSELRIKSTGTIKLFENDNTSSVTIASPASLGADRTITLPDGDVTLVAGTMSTGGVALTGTTNNQVTTVTGADAIAGEANLTFDGSTLAVTADVITGFQDTAPTATSMGTAHANDSTLLLGGLNSGATQGSLYVGGQNVAENGVEGAVYGFSGGSQNAGIEFLEGSGDAYGQISMKVGQGTGGTLVEALKIDSIGAVTKPLQPAFFVTKNGSQNNIPINATTTVEWQIEAFDQNGDFASHTFTAPVTGRYAFSALINWSSWDTDFGYAWHRITTSNRTIFANIGSGNQVTADGYFFASSSILCDMDANDTCKIEIQFSNDGATQADIMQSSFFSGHLVC